jgi:purine-nucleoside phosphorylase
MLSGMDVLTPAMLEEAVAAFRARHSIGTLIAAMTAGSGIALSAPGWEKAVEIPYGEVFPFAVRGLPGHTHSVTLWRRGPLGIIAFNGRFHLYQGYGAPHAAILPRFAALLGAPVYLLTNAAGSIDPASPPGSLVVLRDHINLQGANPLVGEWGRWREPLFIDMTAAYDAELRTLARKHAAEVGFVVNEGVYAGMLGPSFETPAEIEMLGRMGARVVGMSTVQEVIAARHMGMRILGLSLVSNLAAGRSPEPLSHEEVLREGEAARGKLQELIARLIEELARSA